MTSDHADAGLQALTQPPVPVPVPVPVKVNKKTSSMVTTRSGIETNAQPPPQDGPPPAAGDGPPLVGEL